MDSRQRDSTRYPDSPLKLVWHSLMFRFSNQMMYCKSTLNSLTLEELLLIEELINGGFKVPSTNEAIAKRKVESARKRKTIPDAFHVD